MPKQCLVLGVLAALAAWAPHPVLAAPPISIAALPAQRSSGNPSVYIGPQNPNPSVPTKWETVLSPRILGTHVALVGGTDKFLWIGRNDPSKLPSGTPDEIAGVYDYATNTFQNITTHDTNPFCCGLTHAADGRVFVVSGHFASPSGLPDGRKSMRLFSPNTPTELRDQPTLLKDKRWYPTATLLPNQQMLINGGTKSGAENGTASTLYERWDPNAPTAATKRFIPDPEYQTKSGKGFYPFQFVLPTGDVYVQIDTISRFIKPDMTFRKDASGAYVAAPSIPPQWKTQFPRSAGAVMLPVSPTDTWVEIVVFGGAPASNPCDNSITSSQKTVASPYSFRQKISWTGSGTEWTYTFSGWEQEDMGIPRVGGEALLLPNGDVFQTGGCQTGCVGGILNKINRGSSPALWTSLYQPDRPRNQRYTVMQATVHPRTYHGTASLSRQGTVVVGGCDACNTKYFYSNATFMEKLITRRQYAIDVFTPPYVLDVKARPAITTVNGNDDSPSTVTITYGGSIAIGWKPTVATETDVKVTSVVLVAPTSVTHSFNTNQRVVVLPITSNVGNLVTVSVPTNVNLLPKQFYMLFVLNGKTYSEGRWVKF